MLFSRLHNQNSERNKTVGDLPTVENDNAGLKIMQKLEMGIFDTRKNVLLTFQNKTRPMPDIERDQSITIYDILFREKLKLSVYQHPWINEIAETYKRSNYTVNEIISCLDENWNSVVLVRYSGIGINGGRSNLFYKFAILRKPLPADLPNEHRLDTYKTELLKSFDSKGVEV